MANESPAARRAVGRKLTVWDWQTNLTAEEQHRVDECDLQLDLLAAQIKALTAPLAEQIKTLTAPLTARRRAICEKREAIVNIGAKRAKRRGDHIKVP